MRNYRYYTMSRNKKMRKEGLSKVIKDLNLAIANKDISDIAMILKESGYLANDVRNCSKELEKVISICDYNIKDCEWKEVKKVLLDESRILNLALERIRERLNMVSKGLPDDLRTFYYLVALESTFRELYIKGNTQPFDSDNQMIKNYDIYLNLCAETSGVVLRYLDFIEKIDGDSIEEIIKIPVEVEHFMRALNYIDLSGLWSGVKEIIDIWIYGDVSIIKEGELITFNTKCELSLSSTISQIAYSDISNAKEFKHFLKGTVINPISNVAMIKNMFKKHPDIELSKEFLEEVLFMDQNHYANAKISIKGILIAYSTLIEISKKRLRKDGNTIRVMSLEDIAIVERKEFWIKQLIKSGVDKKEAVIIMELLVFNNSRDLLDCPLIKMGSSYVLLPGVALKINPAKSMLSNLNSRSINISFKGYDFEKHLTRLMNEENYKFITYHKKVDVDKEYQCDLIFDLNGHVVFVELKSVPPITEFRDYIKNMDTLYEACNQLNRVSDYVLEHESLKELIGIPEVHSVTKVVVSSIPIGTNKFCNGVIITDELCFSGFIQRKAPMVTHIDNKRKTIKGFKLYTDLFEGKPSIEQLKILLLTDPYKNSIKDRRVVGSESINDELGLRHYFYRCGIPSITFGANLFEKDISYLI